MAGKLTFAVFSLMVSVVDLLVDLLVALYVVALFLVALICVDL